MVVDNPYVIEVVYGTSQQQVLLEIQATGDITVEQAIQRSRILDRFPEIDLASAKLGVFGKATKRDTLLHPGDRVEIYRPLIADPRAARKRRAAEGKMMKKGAGATGK